VACRARRWSRSGSRGSGSAGACGRASARRGTEGSGSSNGVIEGLVGDSQLGDSISKDAEFRSHGCRATTRVGGTSSTCGRRKARRRTRGISIGSKAHDIKTSRPVLMDSKGLADHLNGKVDGTRRMKREDGFNVGVEEGTNIGEAVNRGEIIRVGGSRNVEGEAIDEGKAASIVGVVGEILSCLGKDLVAYKGKPVSVQNDSLGGLINGVETFGWFIIEIQTAKGKGTKEADLEADISKARSNISGRRRATSTTMRGTTWCNRSATRTVGRHDER